MNDRVAAVAVDGGDLELGGGLLALVRPALEVLEQGGVLAVLSSVPSVRQDLPAWCRLERHRWLGVEAAPDGRDRHLVERCAPTAARATAGGGALAPREERPLAASSLSSHDGRLLAADVLAAFPFPERAETTTGFAPRGVHAEPGAPAYPFTLLDRDHVAPPEVAELYDQAVTSQWDATRDIPWDRVSRLAPALDAALAQVMSFLAENELSALYVPAGFLPRIHPAYAEVALYLASQLADEARHVDVFLKRARLAGGPAPTSSATTSRSLLFLLELADFTEASFLLSVLGEGTFLDLLRFVEENAPDEATAELARRARNDEARHVKFGLAHVRHGLANDASLFGRLESVVRRRAATLAGATVPAHVQDGLTLLAAGSTEPRAVARGHEAFQELLRAMHEGRLKRLRHAGFSADQAQRISDLHTPNFM